MRAAGQAGQRVAAAELVESYQIAIPETVRRQIDTVRGRIYAAKYEIKRLGIDSVWIAAVLVADGSNASGGLADSWI